MARVDSEWEKLLKKSQPSVFSDEIMFDILSRLLVKSIIRFRCVCMKWYALFGDSSFVAAHLKWSVEGYYYHYSLRDCFYELDNDLRVSYYLSFENFEKLRKLPFETDYFFHYKIVASVDGLVCIQRSPLRNVKSTSVLLLNPATRESRTLPECPGSIHCHDTAIGFGFDPKINDYKVVMMTPFNKSTRVDVYLLRNDRWRSFQVEYFSAFHIYGAHVNGRLHWLAKNTVSNRFIVSFDITDEKIIEIGLPDSVNLNLLGLMSLKCLGKSLILPLRNNGKEIEIWFMKNYGDS